MLRFLSSLVVLYVMATAFPQAGFAAPTDCTNCGDANGDGIYTVADIAYITAFLYAGGPAPAECADIDGYDLITIRDLVVGGTMASPLCVTQPKIVAQPTSDYAISYIDRIPAFVSSHEIFICFSNNSNLPARRVKAFDLPLMVRVDGIVPQSVFATSVGSDWPGAGLSFNTDFATGAIIVSDLDGAVGVGSYRLFKLTVQMQPSPNVRTLTLGYTEFEPTMTGVFAPPNSACHYAMFFDQELNAWQPYFDYSWCICGDADNNGIISISDSVFIINYIFAGGPAPIRVCQGDSDGNSIITISDAVFLIGYIFAGGPAPSGC